MGNVIRSANVIAAPTGESFAGALLASRLSGQVGTAVAFENCIFITFHNDRRHNDRRHNETKADSNTYVQRMIGQPGMRSLQAYQRRPQAVHGPQAHGR